MGPKKGWSEDGLEGEKSPHLRRALEVSTPALAAPILPGESFLVGTLAGYFFLKGFPFPHIEGTADFEAQIGHSTSREDDT